MNLITETQRAQLLANGRQSLDNDDFDPPPVVKRRADIAPTEECRYTIETRKTFAAAKIEGRARWGCEYSPWIVFATKSRANHHAASTTGEASQQGEDYVLKRSRAYR